MEFGSPPLYEVANRVARELDTTHMETLGPFIMALSHVSATAEMGKPLRDKYVSGNIFGGVNRNLAGALLLWRGASMKEEWLVPYYDRLGKNKIGLPGNTSCSRDIKVAL